MLVRLLFLGLGNEVQSLMLERMMLIGLLGNEVQSLMLERMLLIGLLGNVVQPVVVRLLIIGLLGNEVQSLMLERVRLGKGGRPPMVVRTIVVRLLPQKSGLLGDAMSGPRSA